MKRLVVLTSVLCSGLLAAAPAALAQNEPLAIGSGGYNWAGDFNGDGRTDLLSILPDWTASMRLSTGDSLAVSTWDIVE